MPPVLRILPMRRAAALRLGCAGIGPGRTSARAADRRRPALPAGEPSPGKLRRRGAGRGALARGPWARRLHLPGAGRNAPGALGSGRPGRPPGPPGRSIDGDPLESCVTSMEHLPTPAGRFEAHGIGRSLDFGQRPAWRRGIRRCESDGCAPRAEAWVQSGDVSVHTDGFRQARGSAEGPGKKVCLEQARGQPGG